MFDNATAIGYLIYAMQKKGYTEEEITKMKGAMLYAFDMKTVEEAKEIYLKS